MPTLFFRLIPGAGERLRLNLAALVGLVLLVGLMSEVAASQASFSTNYANPNTTFSTASSFQIAGLTATTSASVSGQIDLSWSTVAWAVNGYSLYRNTTNTPPGSALTTVAAGTSTYSDTGLTPGTTYYYWIAGTNSRPFLGPLSASVSAVPSPPAPTIITPGSAMSVNSSSFTLVGTVTASGANSLVKIYKSGVLQSSVQLYGGATDWSITVTLASGANNYTATATLVGAQSPASATSPTITLTGGVSTAALIVGSMRLQQDAAGQVTMQASYTGDSNANSPATCTNCATYKLLPAGSPINASPTQGAGLYTLTVASLSTGVNYLWTMTFTDPDGVVSDATPHLQGVIPVISALGSTATYDIPSITPNTFAPATGQTTTVNFVVSASHHYKVYVADKAGTIIKTLVACASSGGSTLTTSTTWDGSGATADDIYSVRLAAFANGDTTCATEKENVVRTVRVANPTSIQLPAPMDPGSPLTPNTCVPGGMTATVYNSLGRPAVGALVNLAVNGFSQLIAGGSCTAWGTGATSLANQVADANGQVHFQLRTDPGNTGLVTIRVTATSGSVSATTIVFDPPPDPPQGLVLSAGSIRGVFRKSTSQNAVGHKVAWGTRTGVYDHELDLGRAESFHIEDVLPGTRYFVVVRAYNPSGLVGPPSIEQSLLIPVRGIPASLDLQGSVIASDGTLSRARLVAEVLDAEGLPVKGARVRFTIDDPVPAGARLWPLEAPTDEAGQVTTELIAPSGTRGVTIVAVLQNLSSTLRFSVFGAPASATASPSPSPSVTVTPLASPSATASPSASASATVTPSASLSATASPSASLSATASPSASLSTTVTPGSSPSASSGTPGASVTPTSTLATTPLALVGTTSTATSPGTATAQATLPAGASSTPPPTAPATATSPPAATARPEATVAATPTSAPAATATSAPVLAATSAPAVAATSAPTAAKPDATARPTPAATSASAATPSSH